MRLKEREKLLTIKLVNDLFEKSNIKGQFVSNIDLMKVRHMFPGSVQFSYIRDLLVARFANDLDVVEGKFRCSITLRKEIGVLGVKLKEEYK